MASCRRARERGGVATDEFWSEEERLPDFVFVVSFGVSFVDFLPRVSRAAAKCLTPASENPTKLATKFPLRVEEEPVQSHLVEVGHCAVDSRS